MRLDREDFRRLSEAIRDFCGIEPSEILRPRLARVIGPRIEALNLRSVADYCRYLLSDTNRRDELFWLAEAVANNETYFFREEHQLRAFAEEILPELAARGAARPGVKIWSAGCSSGEEPYSIAILVLESGLFDPDRVSIYATDISSRALAKARTGVYTSSSFRTEWARSPKILDRYFERRGDRFQVREEVRRLVRFVRGNLLDPASYGLLPSMDVIFCRNVLIYFPEEGRRKVVRRMHDKLRPGGYLLLGHAETLLSYLSSFECVPLRTALVYRKPMPQPHSGGGKR